MSYSKINEAEISTNMDVRYKDGKIDQITIKMSITEFIDEPLAYIHFNKNFKIMIEKIQKVFGDMIIRQGTEIISVNTYCDTVLGRLK